MGNRSTLSTDRAEGRAPSGGAGLIRYGAAEDYKTLRRRSAGTAPAVSPIPDNRGESPSIAAGRASKEDYDLYTERQDNHSAQVAASIPRSRQDSADAARRLETWGHGHTADSEDAAVEALIQRARGGDRAAQNALLALTQKDERPVQHSKARRTPDAEEELLELLASLRYAKKRRPPADDERAGDNSSLAAADAYEYTGHRIGGKDGEGRGGGVSGIAISDRADRAKQSMDRADELRDQVVSRRRSPRDEEPAKEAKKRRRRPPTPEQRSQDGSDLIVADYLETRARGMKDGTAGNSGLVRSGGYGTRGSRKREAYRDFDRAETMRDAVKSRRRQYAAQPLPGQPPVASKPVPAKDADLSFDQAVTRSRAGDQQVFKQHLSQMIASQGLKAKVDTAIGDWEDGSEDTVLSTFDGTADKATLRYLGAWSGLLANQKSTLTFHPDPGGLDSVYTIQIPETDLAKIRQSLSKSGIPFRTIIPGRKGSRVVIYDQHRKLRDKVGRFAGAYGVPIRESVGNGDFVGGGSRAAARSKYRKIIAEYEAARKHRS